jgi:ribonucleoside-diphosphate reductase alpha chain
MFGESSIYDTIVSEAKIFRSGSGVGQNWSALRGTGEQLSSGGSSSGVMSFLKILDRSADAVKSGGVSRRAAKMVSLDIDHPEIEEFIDWKLKEEQKVASLITGSKTNKFYLNKIIKKWKELSNEKEIDMYHPEIKEIIFDALNSGVEENYIKRSIDIANQGKDEMSFVEMTNDFNDDAYHTVSGQNSNNSVCLTDSFMNAVKNNLSWNLINRVDGAISKTVNAKYLWNKIVSSAWSCADPGVHYKSTMNSWNTSASDGEIHATNPCSEFLHLDNNSCNLASVRLTKFLDENGILDIDKYKYVCHMMTLALEVSITSAILPTRLLAIGSNNYRTIGLGYCDMGALLMILGLPYDSKEAIAMIGGITSILTGQSYLTSTLIASHNGPYVKYEDNKEHMLRVLRNHRAAVFNNNSFESINIKPLCIDQKTCPEYILNASKQLWDDVIESAEKHGVRNSFVSCIAPTGSIGLLMGADTTGIEPDFSLVKFKKLAGGGFIKIINRSVPMALRKLRYDDSQISEIVEYIIGSGQISEIGQGISKQNLMSSGLGREQIEKVEDCLKYSTDIAQCFNVYTLGTNFIESLGILNNSNSSNIGNIVLEKLGFSTEQIEEANVKICGTGTIEGSPHVVSEHYPIFDCAVKSGRYGNREISYLGHLYAVAAAQPFISGASSKTINMSANATYEDVENCYMKAYDLGIKCVALYRDNSKLSQPLNSIRKEDFIKVEEKEIEEKKIEINRRRLPAKRFGKTHEFQIGPFGGPYHKIYLRTGEYEDGSLGEVFIDYAEEDAFARTALGALGRAISISTQYGVPLEENISMLRSISQDPSGQVLHPNVKVAKSIFDAIGKMLDYEYLSNNDAVEYIDPEENSLNDAKILNGNKNKKHYSKIETNNTKATIKQCSKCGATDMIRTSSCTLKCKRCGTLSESGCGG